MAAITLRLTKGSPLTNSEVDANFTSLDQAKVELAGDIGGGSTSSPLVIRIQGRAVSSSAPTTGQTLVWDGLKWAPGISGLGTSTVVSTSIATQSQSFPYAFSAYASNAELQTITPGSQQKVKFQLTEFNVGGFYSSTTSVFKPQVEGYYQLNAEVRLDGAMGTGDEQMIAIWKNGAEYKRGWNTAGVSPNTASKWFAMQIGSLVYFNGTTDYAEIYVQHGNTSNLTVTGVNQTGITYFNGVMIPKMVSTSVSVSTTSNIAAYGIAVQPVNQPLRIAGQFDDRTQVFNLRNLSNSIINGTEYTDSNDVEVVLGGRQLEPWIFHANRWTPWQCEYDAGRRYSFRMKGSKIVFYGQPRRENTVSIKINTRSASRQQIKYPLSPNHIAFGD